MALSVELEARLAAIARERAGLGEPKIRLRSWRVRVWAELSTIRGLFRRAAR
jgi:hypothetical protein